MVLHTYHRLALANTSSSRPMLRHKMKCMHQPLKVSSALPWRPYSSTQSSRSQRIMCAPKILKHQGSSRAIVIITNSKQDDTQTPNLKVTSDEESSTSSEPVSESSPSLNLILNDIGPGRRAMIAGGVGIVGLVGKLLFSSGDANRKVGNSSNFTSPPIDKYKVMAEKRAFSQQSAKERKKLEKDAAVERNKELLQRKIAQQNELKEKRFAPRKAFSERQRERKMKEEEERARKKQIADLRQAGRDQEAAELKESNERLTLRKMASSDERIRKKNNEIALRRAEREAALKERREALENKKKLKRAEKKDKIMIRRSRRGSDPATTKEGKSPFRFLNFGGIFDEPLGSTSSTPPQNLSASPPTDVIAAVEES